jgi:hypothetical protein
MIGCFSPDYHDGSFVCDTNLPRCPEGFHCAADETCWHNGHEPDLAGFDGGVPLPDLFTALPDARPPEGGWVVSAAIATSGGGAANATLRLSNDGLEISDVTCNASFCVIGGITP